MKINKYNKPKDNSGTGRISGGGATTIINGSTSDRAAYSEDAGRLSDTHLIFGQPFNGTQDVAGDLSNVQNITAVGGDIRVESIEDANGNKGGNIYADGDIAAGGNVSGIKFIGDVDAQNVTTDNITAGYGTITDLSGSTIQYDDATFQQALINALNSVDIATENLTVTKQAHFFELIIDKIKAAGGAILLTPADGFKVDRVMNLGSFYRVLWRSTDGERAISNMWRIGDQAICQTFNQATVGTNYNISNKYYWGLVVGTGSTLIADDGLEYHYIDLDKQDYDGTLNPEVGDEIAMLGYRGTDDANRQSAIYLAAYHSLDPTLTAPLFCHYKGINDYNLKSHKYTWFAANGNEIRGNLKVESGQTLQDYLDKNLPAAGESAYLHTAYSNSADGSVDFTKNSTTGDYLYIGLCSNFKVDDTDLTYQDYTWSRLKGDSVKVVTNSVMYAVSNQGTTAPTSGWQNTMPYVPPANYLWTKNTIYYSDGTKAESYIAVRYGANGSKGDKGDDGADGASYTENLLTNTRLFNGDVWVNKDYWQETGEEFYGLKVLCRDANGYGIYQNFQAVAGETYTFSAWLKSDGGDARCYFTISGGGIVTPLTKDVPESSEWTRQAVSFKCTQSGEIACRVQKATGTGMVYIAGYKLERGTNSNTVWTPAATEVAGQDAERCFLIADKAAFKINSDNVVVPDTITVTAYKQVGSGALELFDGSAVRVLVVDKDGVTTTFDEDSGNYSLSGDDVIRSNASQFVFQLVWFDDVLDSLTVPVIYDGANGNDGQDADYYKLVPVTELAQVGADDVLGVNLSYQVVHIVGKTSTVISTSLIGYDVRFRKNTESIYTVLSRGNNPSYSNATYVSNYSSQTNPVQYLVVDLTSTKYDALAGKFVSSLVDTRIVPVTLMAAATFEITDEIKATVQNNYNILNGKIQTNTNNISNLTQRADSITSTVSQHTTTINNLNGQVSTNTQNISTLQQTANGLKSTVESHTETLGQHTDKISEIEQTANNIRLQVDNISLQITDKKIVLDGDTEINGDLTMDNANQGLVLIGNGGTTQIKPTTIGSYQEFSSKSSQTFRKEANGSKSINATAAYAYTDFEHQIGYIKSGVYLQLNGLSYSSTRGDKTAPVASVTFQLFKDGVLCSGNAIATITAPTTGNFFTYTTSAAGNYTIKIRVVNQFDSSTTYSSNTVECKVSYNIVLPTDALTILGYDGYASNFGNNKIVYFGSEQTVISYGDAKLRFSTNGIEKYAGTTGARRMNNGIYTDSATSNYPSEWVALNGSVVRKITTAGEVYLQQNDEFIVVTATSGTVNINLLNAMNFDSIGVPNKNMVGRKIYIKKLGGCTMNIKGYTGDSKNLVNPADGALLESYNPQGKAMMVMSDGQYWHLYYCG